MKTKDILTLSTALGLLCMSGARTFAQSVNQKQPDPFQSNEQNPVYGEGINPLDLIHNANLLNRRSSNEFIEDSNQNLDSAARDFKEQQKEKILEMLEKEQSPNPDLETE
jgi:hypothetical protein